MTLIQTIFSILVLPALAGAGVGAKLYGDTLWLPISQYQQEKYYDLQDQAEAYTDKEEFEGGLSESDKRKLKRLLKQIDRLELDLQ